LLMKSGLREQLRGNSWGAYQHTFGSAASEAQGSAEAAIDFDSDLMRLAVGGK